MMASHRPCSAFGPLPAVATLAVLAGCFDAERLIATERQWDPFGPPQLVTGIRSDNDDVQDPSLSDDELELVFASPTGGSNDIWSTRRAAATDPWATAAPVAELSSPQNDEDPELSSDGLSILFSSDRAGDGMRLYVARRPD